MAEFCKCGSIMINGQCTNKNCTDKASGKSDSALQSATGNSKKKGAKSAKTKRASKVITYNLYEVEDESEREEDVL